MTSNPFKDEWLQKFIQTHGRAPRILHIGNVGNNAFLNAYTLNEHGYDCDVLSYDYYHVMSCPEWELGDFRPDELDENFPDWTSKKIADFQRPGWFAQGPIYLCAEYLLAKRTGKRLLARMAWRSLSVHNRTVSRRFYDALLDRFFSMIQQSRHPGLSNSNPLSLAGKIKASIKAVLLKLFKLDTNEFRNSIDYEANAEKLVQDFRVRFPNRSDKLHSNDLAHYKDRAQILGAVLKNYDLTIGYSTDTLWAMIAGFKKYVGFEHGTIRDIPFADDFQGRLCALSYSMAGSLLMTNADSIPQARALRPNDTKTVYGTHGYSARLIHERLALSKGTTEERRFGFSRDTKVFFAPARHDWEIKGNDRIVHAILKLKNEKVANFRVIFVLWGKDVSRTKELINELEVGDYVRWISPIGKVDLIAAYSSVDAVIDQFIIPCMGGIPIEAMTVGAPIITKLDDALNSEFFGETIPLFNCEHSYEIARAMKTVITEPQTVNSVIESCRRWMQEHHSEYTVVTAHAKAYELAFRDS